MARWGGQVHHQAMHVCSSDRINHWYVSLAGALLAVGITNCGVQDECDPAYALLCESVNHADDSVRIGAIMGLGLAYAGTQKAEVQVSLQSHLTKLLASSLTYTCTDTHTSSLALHATDTVLSSALMADRLLITAIFKLCILLQTIAGLTIR